MFADALLDSRHLGHSRRGWATLTSFGIQAFLVACLLIIPLFYTQVLPRVRWISTVPLPAIEPVRVHIEQIGTHTSPPGAIVVGTGGHLFQVPPEIPRAIDMSVDSGPPILPVGTCIHCVRGEDVSQLMTGAGADIRPPVSIEKPRASPPVSVMMEGFLIHRVEPIYPVIAKTAGIHGPVVIEATIGKDGSIEKLQVVKGHPFLVKAALEAVSQWRYRPYVLNNSAIEVDTQITVNFVLSR